jgi:hypothetical protein
MSVSISVVKALFALSGNTCAYDGCEVKLADPAWTGVNADIAHICGERPGSPRFDPTMTDDERDDFDNLILLCPNHHRLIDALEPAIYTVEMLREMKHRHESRSQRRWAPDEELFRLATYALRPPAIDARPEVYPPIVLTEGAPRLVAQHGPGQVVEVVNEGDGDAYGITVQPLRGMGDAWVSGDAIPSRLSPGARWRAGLLAPSLADEGPYVLRLTWRDASGRAFDGDFPVG